MPRCISEISGIKKQFDRLYIEYEAIHTNS